jgi:UDP-glucose 4-epimerase
MKYVITGGAGFIGSHLTEYILKVDHSADIIVVDSLICGEKNRLSDKILLVQKSIQSLLPDEWDSIFFECDYVFHLAAMKYNTPGSNPSSIFESNIVATENIFASAARNNIKRVVFTSSLYAYGSLGPEIMTENDPLQPITHYGMSKVAGENIAHIYSFRNNLDFTIARLFFIYGPNQYVHGGYKSVINKSIELINSGLMPEIFGSGKQSMDFVYIEDCVEALFLMSRSAEAKNGTFNVSSQNAITVKEVLVILKKLLKSEVDFKMFPKDWTEGSKRVGSNAKIITELGWSPKIQIESGLMKMLNLED